MEVSSQEKIKGSSDKTFYDSGKIQSLHQQQCIFCAEVIHDKTTTVSV